MQTKLTSVRFSNFKALNDFSISLDEFNLLVGPNNYGKSTVVSAFRALSGAKRRAEARRAEFIQADTFSSRGHKISEELLGITVENVHTDYSDKNSEIHFRYSNGNVLKLHFPKNGGCLLEPVTQTSCEAPVQFKRMFPTDILVLPVLSRLEHLEDFIDKDTVSRNLYTHRASRNFRNYWFHFPDEFELFAEMLKKTWPEMEVSRPELDTASNTLRMFCQENRIARELFWAGSGFQIWCQILTYLSRVRPHSLVVIDEPEVYLHPDLQRRLVYLLRELNCDVVVATHSTEMMTEVDPSDILVVDKKAKSARRLKDIDEVQTAIEALGSAQNITMTKVARTRKVLFVEGETDFKVLQKIAARCGFASLGEESNLTPIPSGGFSFWERIRALDWGFAKAIGKKLHIAVVFDRDYRPHEEIQKISEELGKAVDMVCFLNRKEVENYLLDPRWLNRAIEKARQDRENRSGTKIELIESLDQIVTRITDGIFDEIQSQYIARRIDFFKGSSKDVATLTQEAIRDLNEHWKTLGGRIHVCPGKKVLKALRTHYQKFGLNITDMRIVAEIKVDEVPGELVELFKRLVQFGEQK